MSRTERTRTHRMQTTKRSSQKGKVWDGTPTHASQSCRRNGGCSYCENNRLFKHERSDTPQENPISGIKILLCKLSIPGYEIEVGSELEAKELLYNEHICSGCLKDIAFRFDNGERREEGEEYRIPEIHEVSLNDLLGTACGCEFDVLHEELNFSSYKP